MQVIGFLSPRSASDVAFLLPAFHQGLKEVGYNEGQNVAVDYRFADAQYHRTADASGEPASSSGGCERSAVSRRPSRPKPRPR